MGTIDYESMAASLDANENFRVLRKLKRRDYYETPDGTPIKLGIVVDVETTGLDSSKDEIIEIGMVKFEFSADGRIFRVVGELQGFQAPSIPIPKAITELTGIDAGMVAGMVIDPTKIADFVNDSALIVAHNAAFDRRFCERYWPCFAGKPWACSAIEIDWKGEGFDGARLGYLLNGCGLFHDGHRAVEDCRALLEVLAHPLPRSGDPAIKCLLENARRSTIRIWAEKSPYETKDALRARGYRWGDGSDGSPKAWWIDVHEEMVAPEIDFLRSEIYRGNVEIPTKKLTAFDRFSDRVSVRPTPLPLP